MTKEQYEALKAKDQTTLTDAEKTSITEYEAAQSGDKGLDVEAVKALLSDSLEKTVDRISTDLVSKFKAGVEDARKKAIDTGVKQVDKTGEITRKFLRALLSGDKVGAKAISTSTSGSSPDDSDAGLLIPTELTTEVLRIAEKQFGLARREMLYLPFSGPGNTRQIPTLGTSVSVFWTGEGVKKQSTQPSFGIVTQTLKKLAAIVPFTEEILEDSAINITQLVATLFAEAVSKEEDIQFFAGTGAPWIGILNNPDVNILPQTTGGVADLTADDLLDMIDETPTGALVGAKFYMNRKTLSIVRKLKGIDGQYIFQRPQDGLPGTIWDYPYELSDAFPAPADVEDGDQYILFGNLKQGAVFGDKQQLRTQLLSEATITDTDGQTAINLAEQDMVALRIVERVGYVVGLAKALTVLEAGESSSPVA